MFEPLAEMFPTRFTSVLDLQRGVALQKFLLKWLDVKDGSSKELDEYRSEYSNLIKPRRFIGDGSFEMVYIREFEETCHTLQSFSKRNIKEMNIVEYYTLIDYAEEKIKNGKKSGGLGLLALLGGA